MYTRLKHLVKSNKILISKFFSVIATVSCHGRFYGIIVWIRVENSLSLFISHTHTHTHTHTTCAWSIDYYLQQRRWWQRSSLRCRIRVGTRAPPARIKYQLPPQRPLSLPETVAESPPMTARR